MDTTSQTVETDEEKLERLGKKYNTEELESKAVLKDSDTEKDNYNPDDTEQGNSDTSNSQKHDNEYSDDNKSDNERSKHPYNSEPSQIDINDKQDQVEISSPQSSTNSDKSDSEINKHDTEKETGISQGDEKSLSKRDNSTEFGITSKNTDMDEAEQQNYHCSGESDPTQESSEADNEKVVKSYQQPSYSLSSRQKSSLSSDSSPEKSTLHVSTPKESLFLTPRDIDLTEDEDKGLDVKTTANDPINNVDSEQRTNDLEQEISNVDIKGGKQETPVTSDQETDKDVKATNINTSAKENEKAKDKELKESPKQHVKLNLSNENTNKGNTPVKGNIKTETHIKKDFQQRRPVQTTTTKTIIKATSEEKTGTNAVPSSRSATRKSASSARIISPREIVARERVERQRKAQSARPGGRGNETVRSTSSRASSRTSGPPSRPRSCGDISAKRQMKEFFQAELRRLKQSLGSEAKKFKKPKVRDHYPYVYTSLVPYCSTYEANFLINMPEYGYKEKHGGEVSRSVEKKGDEEATEEDKELMFTTRPTAIRLCDPWHSLKMDRNVLPKLETAELRQRRMDQMRATAKPKSPRQKRPEAKQGSTRLPKFPVIQLSNQELATKELYYGDVPMIRDELTKNYGHNGEERKKSDYKRTKQDFFRMELDRLSDYHEASRPHMRAAYYAYLQNTPGSRKALVDCMREIQSKKEPQSPQAVA